MTKNNLQKKDPKYKIGARVIIDDDRCTIINVKQKHLRRGNYNNIWYNLYKVVRDADGKTYDIAEGHILKQIEDKSHEEINLILLRYAAI